MRGFLILAVFSVMIIFISIHESRLEKVSVFDEPAVSFSEHWFTQDEDAETQAFSIPNSIQLEPHSRFKIHNTLPTHFTDTKSLSLYTTCPNLSVYINGVRIYKYGYDSDYRFANNDGNTYHIIRLPQYTEGKRITLEFTSGADPINGKISSVTIGTKAAILLSIIQTHFFSFLLCCLIFGIGITYILIFFFTKLKFQEGKSLLYLGLFALLISGWSATETKMLQFFIPYQYVENMIAYLTLMLSPIPYLLFLKGASHSSHSRFINILATLCILNFLGTNTLVFCGLFSYSALLLTTQLLVLLTMAATIYTITKELLYYRSSESYLLGCSILILLTAAVIDFLNHRINDSGDSSYAFRIGLLLFLLLIGLSSVRKILHIVKMGINSHAIQKLAYVDLLTNIKNRNAYVKEIDELNNELTEHNNIIVVMFDLNNLKEANDTFGHTYGDALIVAAAECIHASFDGYGISFRIGGDEFATIVKDIYDSFFLECMVQLENRIQEYNQSHEVPLEIPYGYTHFDPEIDCDLYSTFSRADVLMYEAKARMKANKNTD